MRDPKEAYEMFVFGELGKSYFNEIYNLFDDKAHA